MNICILKGNLGKEPEIIFAKGTGNAVTKFSIAVARMKKEDGADFFPCVAFGKTAELIANSLHKGSPILIEGYLKTGNYENKAGQKVYTTDVIVNKFEFIEKKQADTSNNDMELVEDSSDIPF